jgi:hypothetical protein
LEEIARGGMGVVFKARQLTLNRLVALKMILAGQLAGEADVQRFYTEAQTAANLQHPNIVAIHEVGYQDGQHFFSMDYVEGRNLADLVREHPLPPPQAVRYVKLVAEAIQHAHQQGTLHRDLKPSNVLIDKFDQPRVTDFGLARRLQSDQGITATGTVLGTPSYMPPEQASADRGKLGPPTDVYSLGAVLYELVTGRPPFRAASPLETLLQVLTSDPAAPRLLNAAIDRDLETILLKCLAKEPERRYASARELADDLGAYLDGRPIKARRPGLVERTGRWVRKHRRNAALIAVTATASVLLLAGGWVAVNVYRQGQMGRLQLNTHGPFLIAQVLDLAGKAITPRFTVPTQEPVPLPEGSYRLRLSGQGGLAETFRLEVAHGIERHFAVDLKDQFLWEPLKVPRAFETVDLAGRADVLLLSEKDVSLHHGATGATLWTAEPTTRNEKLPAEWKWDWRGPNARGGWETVDRRPFLVKPAPDLDGDGVRDVVLASRQQAGLMALSGKTGQLLWSFLRSNPADGPEKHPERRHLRLSEGTVIGVPALADVDGDGMPDLVVTLALAGDRETPPQRWVEAVSGRTGKSLWRYDLDDQWFKLPAGSQAPYACRWFGAEGGPWIDGSPRFTPELLYAGNFQRRLGGSPMPYAAAVVPVAGRPRVALMAGTRLISLDLATGRPLGPARDVGFWPARPPQFADLAGDGQGAILLCRQEDGEERLELVALNLKDHEVRWRQTVRAIWAWSWYEQPPEWPLIADLDTDGRLAVIVPTGDVAADLASRWVGLEVLEGATGEVRWQRRLVQEHRTKRPLAQVNRFVVGPDLNRDGHREIFVVTSSWQARPGKSGGGEMPVFFVDALSGQDGQHSLWWFRQALPNAAVDRNFGLPFGPLRWWQRGLDGWPQLLVPRLPVVGEAGRRDERPNETYLLSAGTGRLMQTEGDLPNPEVVDLDGDGIADLLCFRPDRREVFEGSGRLQAIRGRSPEAWRRLGGAWEPAQDFAGEGVPALITAANELRGSANPLQQIRAISGRDGRLLWVHESPRSVARGSGERLSVAPLPHGDLDGDGVPDVLSVHPVDPVLDRKGNVLRFTPLEALSGKTGRRLWTAGLQVKSWHATALLECHDLEGDGRRRVLLSGVTDPGDEPARPLQLWLVVLSGQDGRLLWKQVLVDKDLTLGGQSELRLQPLVIDLNGDGVRDLVVPAVRAGKDPEVRVFSGRDGQLLWELPPAPRVDADLERDRVFVAAGDLDGLGRPDVVLLRTVAERQGKKQFETYCEVLVLEGASGRVKGQWRTPVDHAYGQVLGSLPAGAAGPIPLLVDRDGSGRHAIGVWTSHYALGTYLVLLDSGGRELQPRSPMTFAIDPELRRRDPKHRLTSLYGGAFQVWSHDLDGDGADELLFFGDNELLATRGDPTHVLWRWPLPDDHWRLLDIWPAQAGRPTVVIVQAAKTVYGLAGPTGKLLWRCAGPGVPTAVLRSSHSQEWSRVVFSVAKDVSACYVAFPATAGPDDLLPVPLVESAAEDPRVWRPLPWYPLKDLPWWLAMPPYWFWLITLSLSGALLIIPSQLLGWAVQQRSWLLGLLPLLWVLVVLAVAFAVLFFAYAERIEVEISQMGPVLIAVAATAIFGMWAVLGLPLAAFMAVLLASLWRRRWARAGLLIGFALLLAAPVAWVWLAHDQRSLSPGLEYSLKGWYWVGLTGTYAVGLLVILGFVLRRGFELGRRLVGSGRGPKHASIILSSDS